jgi:hypothetical protein
MQTPTHMVAGVLLQKTFVGKKHRRLVLTTVAVLAFLSHGFLDKLSRVTFHPADPDFHSVFWVTYHSLLLVLAIVTGIIWWRPYKWGIIFANLPDVDWVFIHGQEIVNRLFHTKIDFYGQPYFHHFLGYIYDHIPPFSWMANAIDRLPNERHNPWACLWELVLVCAMLVAIWMLSLARSYTPKGEKGEERK